MTRRRDCADAGLAADDRLAVVGAEAVVGGLGVAHRFALLDQVSLEDVMK